MRHLSSLLFLLLITVAPAAAQTFWTSASGPYGGTSITSMVTTPSGVILIGGPNGVFASEDGGATWHSRNEGLQHLDVRALAALDDGAVLAGTYGGGVFVQWPGGTRWTSSGMTGVLTNAIAADEEGTWYVGTLGGLVVSSDQGQSWEEVDFFSNLWGGVRALLATADYLYAGTLKGLYRSADDGATWQQIGAGIGELEIASLAANDEGVVFAGTAPERGVGRLYRSRNHGDLWTGLQLSSEPFYVTSIALGDDGALYAGGYGRVFRSTDLGDTWQQATVAATSITALAVDGRTVLAGTVGRGVARSTNAGQTWHESNQGILSTINDVAVDGMGALYVATAGGVFRSDDRGAMWERTDEGLRTFVTRALTTDRQGRIVVGTAEGIYRWDAEADGWRSISPAADPSIDALMTGPDGALYAGYGQGVYRMDGQGTWKPRPLMGPDQAYREIIALAVNDDGAIFAGSYYDAFRALPASGWSTLALTEDGSAGVQAFSIDGSGAVYAGTRWAGVLVSRDEGDTWVPLNGGLTGREDVRALATDRLGRLHAGTYGSGVYYYDATAGTWRTLNSGLGDYRVTSLAFDPAGNAYAGTVAGGLFVHRTASSVAVETDAPGLPSHLVLHDNYPNPFNPTTTIHFDLPRPARVGVSIYDLTGRRVMVLPERSVPAGSDRSLILDAASLPSGVYLYRLVARSSAGSTQVTGRMVLVK